jgi:hypothetical protein
MEIYSYLNMKQVAAIKGENTGINFPYLNRIKKQTEVQRIVQKIYGN